MAPKRKRVPGPAFVNPPAPLPPTVLAKMIWLLLVSNVGVTVNALRRLEISADEVVLELTDHWRPELTAPMVIVFATPAPRFEVLLILTKPPLIVATPVKVFAPVSVRIPVPVFVIAPVPEMTPAYVVLSLLPPMVRVAAPKVTLPLVVPPPDNEPIETLNPVISITVPVVLER